MQFHKAFYKKHGIKITDEAIDKGQTPEQLNLERSINKTIKRHIIIPQTVRMIEESIEKYPNSEALKNYLYIACVKVRQYEKALDCLHNTIKLHPDYAFGPINLVNYYINKKELDKASALFSEPYDVRSVEKMEFVNYSIFIAYYQSVVMLELAKGNIKMAEKYHQLMFEYDPKDKTVQQLSEDIWEGRIAAMQKGILVDEIVKDLDNDRYNKFLSNGFSDELEPEESSKDYDEDDDYYAPPQETVRRVEPKLGRNDLCHCGSGKKYKKCHGA
jgi:tetratricopeptide (TPR) repeat protein